VQLEFKDVCSDSYIGKGNGSGGQIIGGDSEVDGGGSSMFFGGSSSVLSKSGTARSNVVSRGGANASRASMRDDASSSAVTSKSTSGQHTTGLKKFQDKQIPSGFGIGEVCVIMKQGQGIVGLTSIAKGEDKLRELGKFGCFSIGNRETFKLKNEEQVRSETSDKTKPRKRLSLYQKQRDGQPL